MNRLIQKILLGWLTLVFCLTNYASAESSPPIDLSKFYILPVSIEANEAIPLADADLALEYSLKVALRKQAMLQINPYIHSLSLQATITSYSHERLVVLLSIYDEQNLIQRFELSRIVPVNAEWSVHLTSLAEDIMLELQHKMVELPCYPNCITEPPCNEQCEPQHAFMYFYPAYQPIIIQTPSRPYSPHYDSATKAIIHSTPSSASEIHIRDTQSDSEHPSSYQPPQSSPSIPVDAPQTPNQPISIYQSPPSSSNNQSNASPHRPIEASVNSTSTQHNTDSSRSQPPSSARSGTDTVNRRVSTESPSVYKPSTSTNSETSNQRRSTENSSAYKPSTSSNADMSNQRSNTESINKPSASADTSNQRSNNESSSSNHASGRDDDSGRNKRNGKKD